MTKEWFIKHDKLDRYNEYHREYQKEYIKNNPWHKVYHNIKSRCTRKNIDAYKYYGGRGIKCFITRDEVRKLWFRDMAENMKKPSIDRINNYGNYTYKNCRFIEMSENIAKKNKKPVEMLSIEGDYIKIFDSCYEAAMSLFNNVTRGINIASCCRGKQKTAYGYKWRYK